MAVIGGVNLGGLTDYLFVFTNGSKLAGWIGATNGYVGDVAIDGIQANENASGGTLAYAGTIFTNDVTCDEWQMIVDQNPGQAFCSTGNVALIAGLETDLSNAFAQIEALPVTPGFESVNAFDLDGLNTQNGVNELIVINITSGFSIGSKINIFGDPGDVYVFRWDQDANPANGYQGQVNFHGGGAFVPASPGMKPTNFINVAGSISSSGGGTNPPPPYPQGPRFNDGQGALINGGSDFKGGGFFTGYWLTKGDPVLLETGSIGNARFVGGWFSSTVEFQLHSGAGGVYVSPNPATLQTPGIDLVKEVSVDGGVTFVDANVPPFPVLFPPTNPVFRFTVTNTGNVTLTNVAINDNVLGPILIGGTLAPGASTSVTAPGTFAAGQHCNTATATGQALGQTVTDADSACYIGAQTEPCISLIKQVSVNGGVTFEDADTPPGPTLTSPTNPIFRFVITNCGPVPVANIALNDSVLGPIAVPPVLLPGQSFTTTVTGTFAFGQNCNTATVVGTANGTTVSDADTACFSGVSGAAIEVIKLVSVDGGVTFIDAHSPPFPVLVAPNTPIYQFVVNNIGTVTLTNVTLVDSDFGPILLPDTTLSPGESVSVTLPRAFTAGQHCNTATATGTGDEGDVTATDFACYVGVEALSIDVEKLVSVDGGITFVDADLPPGPTLVSPNNPIFRFIITNNSSVTLTNVTLTDTDFGVIPVVPNTLAPGASFTVDRTGTFALGQHTNTATATGQFEGTTVSDSDPANYIGVAQVAIQLQKLVSVNNGATFVDANTPPGPTLVQPNNPRFRFIITNTGITPLTNLTLVDTTFGAIGGLPLVLAPGASFTTELVGTFAVGQHCNVATATGTGLGQVVTDTDSACYRAVISALPQFPDISNPAPQDQIIDRLLETIALEELALAALINAEAEKVQAVVAAGVTGPVDAEELERINLAVAEVIRLAGVKEEHLRRKLIRILAHKEQNPPTPPPIP